MSFSLLAASVASSNICSCIDSFFVVVVVVFRVVFALPVVIVPDPLQLERTLLELEALRLLSAAALRCSTEVAPAFLLPRRVIVFSSGLTIGMVTNRAPETCPVDGDGVGVSQVLSTSLYVTVGEEWCGVWCGDVW